MDAAAAEGLTSAVPLLAASNTVPARQAACGAPRRQVGLSSKSPFSISLTSLMSFLPNGWTSAAESTTTVTTANILYGLDAHLTGLCSWASPLLTTAFVSLACAWLAVEAEIATSTTNVMLYSAVVMRHIFFTTALCACDYHASAQEPLSTM
ncbi:hypothetical protein, unknown function [Leishmania mexicana MHOM/GT/2001/U1103]|uniref:Uncharacterized protein n=1 Tax=Leishmania mexicana (strain MHOM/GT/2001/U1103) TaxID=929439 RepID=E9B706_LEIMU|nr:hypothetical protein, unknown function [Leishmania mexicana MHOM/GT/2001/U1103]CBZ31029.1 hypothetical protein, unknown function [Leishmania mexicana MHOM/GT/2001/U1103]